MIDHIYSLGGKYKVEGVIINTETGKHVETDIPFFILIAKDKNALQSIAHYAEHCKNEQQRDACMQRAYEFMDWQQDHPDEVREPDIE